ncbi:MAG: Smr/MutS family protein [Erysipelotrichaceae bacterium]|nr:Smr/MutS family protein [Erysipelotrichaceae bacterium]
MAGVVLMNDYSNLDLDVIHQQIAKNAAIREAKDLILNEEVSFNPLQIRKKISETAEALKLLNEGFLISFDGIENVSDLLEKADKNIMLTGQELKKTLVFHHHCKRIAKLFTRFNHELSICDYTDSISTNDHVFDKIENCIDSAGEVKDDASDRLKQIRMQLEQCEKDLYSKAYTFIDKHGDSLQESSIYLRNDRITFLIKNTDKNRFQGYTYGSSASGLAFYVEPASFIDLNNKKIQLMQDRDDEIERILIELSYLVSSVSDLYIHNFESLMLLCVIFAKADFGFKRKAIVAAVEGEKYFEFKDLCHPLIDENKVVSNSYRLYPPYQGIVISGSNTGGKTVSLKAIGLSVIMTYLGIPIVASEAKVPFYKNVYIDIDDNQSIQDSLSTFSAHITNINSILNDADEHSLILIDELISGTDPKEAQAISLAILDQIKEKKSVFIITTHFDDIKKYSYEDEQILLSSVGFNMNTLMPTYRYLEDSIGSSNAIEIASRYFDNSRIIDSAKDYLKKNQSQQDELLNRLSRQIDENELEKERLNRENQRLEATIREYETKIAEFELEKQKLKDRYLEELNAYIEEVKEQAIEKLESISDRKQKEVVDEIEDLAVLPPEEKEENVELKVGDHVRISDNEQIGVLTSINKENATVDIRGITIKTKLSDLTLIPVVQKQETRVYAKKYSRVPSQINLVGERVEDGLIMMEEYLDKANAAHMSSVKVIHGIGTGQLRTALRNRMKKLSYIKSFKDGDYYDGGSAVTIVEFK